MLKGPPPRDSQKSLKLFAVDLTIAGSPKIWLKWEFLYGRWWNTFWSLHVWPGLHQTVYTLLPNAKPKKYTTYRTNDTGGMLTYHCIKLYCHYNNTYWYWQLYNIYIHIMKYVYSTNGPHCVYIYTFIVNTYIYIHLLPPLTHIPANQQKKHLVECLCCLHLPLLGLDLPI